MALLIAETAHEKVCEMRRGLMKKRLRNFENIYVALLLCFISLLIVLISGMWKNQQEQGWQADSEILVWGRIDESQRKGVFSRGGLLRGYHGLGEDYMIAPELYVQGKLPAEADIPYCRQSGAQGTFFTLIAMVVENTIGREYVPKVIWGINSVLFVWVMLLLSWWLFHEFGWGAALGSISCIVLCPWLTKSMANAYWVIWTMLLPMVITAFMGYSINASGKSANKLKWYLILFLGIFLRFLCGYEFMSTIMIASEIPIFFYFLKSKHKEERRQWFIIAFVIGCVEIFAFVISIGITIIQIASLPGSTFMQGVESIVSAVKYRTGAFVEQQDMQRYVPAIVNALEKGRLEVVTDYLKSSEKLWLSFSAKEICKFWLTSVAVRFLVDTLCEKKRRTAGWNFILQGLIICLSLMAAVSWYYLAAAHAALHSYIDYVIMQIPFVPIAIAFSFQNFVCIIWKLFNRFRGLVSKNIG